MTREPTETLVFEDVAVLVGPKKPTSNVCFCLSYRIGSKENLALRGPARAERVRQLCARARTGRDRRPGGRPQGPSESVRIIGGSRRGLKLADVGAGDAAAHLRPTSDRVREAMALLHSGLPPAHPARDGPGARRKRRIASAGTPTAFSSSDTAAAIAASSPVTPSTAKNFIK